MLEDNRHRGDEIDALVRWAFRDSVGDEEPSPEVWDRIRARLEEQPKGQFFRRRGRVFPAQLSWLVQLLALGVLVLLAFGFSLSQGFDLSLDHEYVVNGELTPQPGSEEVASPSTDDVLSGHYLFQSARELTVFDYRLVP